MLLVTLALAAVASDPTPDFPALDAAIAACGKEATLPFFAGEGERRSRFLTEAFAEQAAINRERRAVLDARRALRENTASEAREGDRQLSLTQLALDDRQRVLDDRRRLEALRQEAVDFKRQHYLVKCAR